MRKSLKIKVLFIRHKVKLALISILILLIAGTSYVVYNDSENSESIASTQEIKNIHNSSAFSTDNIGEVQGINTGTSPTPTNRIPTPLPTTTPFPPTSTPIPRLKISYGGWIPSFDFENGLSSASDNKKYLSLIHYAGASINAEGKITYSNNFEGNLSRINELEKPFGINIHSSSPDDAKKYLNSKSNQEEFLKKLNEWKKLSNFDSINFNIEKLYEQDRDLLFNYYKDITKKANDIDIKVFSSVFPVSKIPDSLYTVRDRNDYKSLSSSVNYVIIMAYDYVYHSTVERAKENPNVPDYWLDNVLSEATRQIPKEKLVIGLPLYGYSYNTETHYMQSSYVYNQIANMINQENLTPKLQRDWNEMSLKRGNSITYYQTPETLNNKKKIIAKYGVKKIFYWRLGGDNGIGYKN